MNAKRIAEAIESFKTHLGSIDELSLVVLKGHLIIEEYLERIISRFVFHADKLESARFTFAQKVAIARSISLDEYDNSMWELILAINALRNDLAHTLVSPKREAKTNHLLDLLKKECEDSAFGAREVGEGAPARVTEAIAMCVGFLNTFDEEIERFRDWVDGMDKIVNPHRHKDSQQPPA
jgi:hypothetical protein